MAQVVDFITKAVGVTAVGIDDNLTDPNCQNPELYVICTVETSSVRWRADGTSPTATVGQLLHAGDCLVFDGDQRKLKFIRDTSAAVDASITAHHLK